MQVPPKSHISLPLLLSLLLHLSVALKFCAWYPQGKSLVSQSLTPPAVVSTRPQPQSPTHHQIQSQLQKRSQFRSYHPHYLHSYSYPMPVTSHIYLGQMGNNGKYVYLIRNDDEVPYDSTAEIVYVNGGQEYGAPGRLSSNAEDRLRYAMVVQVENMLDRAIDGLTVNVRNYGDYLGIACRVYEGKHQSFIVHFEHRDGRVLSVADATNQLQLQFKNYSAYDPQQVWKNAFYMDRNQLEAAKNVTLVPGVGEGFSTLVITIKYGSVADAQDVKLAIREFITQAKTLEDIEKEMGNIQIRSPQYTVTFTEVKSRQACEVKAEKQLLQGLSYEYGTLELKNGYMSLPNKPKPLFSFTPSRRRFPWGFLWDDGFHCEVAARADHQVALEVVKSWLDSMEDSGWIPREQNRGAERVFLCSCPAFMAKDVRDGNPPTLLLSLLHLSRQGILSTENFEHKYWEKLEKWYNWFLSTQMSQPNSFVFRWHDSIPGEGSFNSGMDDFPRLPNTQGHVDCQSWMYFFSTTLVAIGKQFKYDVDKYQTHADQIKQKFAQNFIEPITNIPRDYATVQGKLSYNPHFGYPSILPLAFGLVDEDSPVFNSTLSKIQQELDLGHGLTSLSRRDPLFMATSSAYWRGPVWVNINYLFVRGLHMHYPSRAQYYQKLRTDLIATVCREEEQRGDFFENYIDGKGSFSHPFTGWTALIAVIIRESY